MEGVVHTELLAACSSLGYADGTHYRRDADCLASTKDLLRYLRRDDESHEVRRALGDTRVLQTDLLPLLQHHGEDEELLELVLRLLVDLTNPTVLLFREELPEEKKTRWQFLQLVRYQQAYKEAFTCPEVWGALAARLRGLLEVPKPEREEDHRLLMERLLVLTRNVLWVPASPEEGRTDDDASLHDQMLWAINLSGMAELLLYVAACPAEHDFALHLLEILSHMLREQEAAHVASAQMHTSHADKQEDLSRLEAARRQESVRREARRRATSSRHSRFGGTYVVREVKGVAERDLVLHRPLASLDDLTFDRHKAPRKYNKNRVPVQDACVTRRSAPVVRFFLREFCTDFLLTGYNGIMAAVREALDRQRSQHHDETYYLWGLRFFMELNRLQKSRVDLVTETLSIEAFHFIQTHLDTYHEMMTAEKKKACVWSRRMHTALRAYQELLATLQHMDGGSSPEARESSRVLKSRLFYMVEYRELLLLLLQNYSHFKHSLGYLRDIVQASHTFLKLLEGMCRPGRHVMVQARARAKARKKAKKTAKRTPAAPLTPDQLQDMWSQLSSELLAAVELDAAALPFVMPYDPLSEDTEDTQKAAAVKGVSRHLRAGELPEAVAMLRAAREVFPEGDIFGPRDAIVTQDFLLLQEIFMADLDPLDPVQEEEEEEEEEEDEEEEEERMAVMSDQEFDFQGFVRRFATTKVVNAYTRLLHHYSTNTTHTNHCILKLFHRLAWDCKLPAIFYQASLYTIFLRAMEDPLRRTSESPKEIARFGTYIIRQMYKAFETNPKVMIEMLFWKTNKEASEIECGYMDVDSGRHATGQAWAEEEEEELKTLYAEVEQIPTEERGDKDVADLVMDLLIRKNRTRRSVIRKLKELGLIRNLKELKNRAPRISAPRQWTEEEEEELRRLFTENTEAMDVVGRIMDSLTIRRPKHRVVEKILELGLVGDRKELRKKRAKKPTTKTSKRKTGQNFLEANQSGDEESDERSESSASESGNENGDDDDNNTDTEVTRPPPPPPAPIATPALISQSLEGVLTAGRKEAVEWLVKVLTDVADDREEDGDFEPVPILAITQGCTDAMEDEVFHNLLRLVGLQAPLSHQEMFWRVPSKLTVAGLRKRALYLTQGVSGDLQHVDNADEPLEPIEAVKVVEIDAKKTKKKTKKSREPEDEISLLGIDAKKPKNKIKKPKTSEPKTKPRVSKSRKRSENKENLFSGVFVPSGDDDDSLPSTSHRLLPRDDSSDEDTPLSSLTALSSSNPRVNKRMLSDDDDSLPSTAHHFIADDDSSDEETPLPSLTAASSSRARAKRMLSDDDDSLPSTSHHLPRDDSSDEETPLSSLPSSSRARAKRMLSDDDDDSLPLTSHHLPRDDYSDEETPLSSLPSSSRGRAKRMLSDDGDSDVDTPKGEKIKEKTKNKKKKRMVVDSDSEEEREEEGEEKRREEEDNGREEEGQREEEVSSQVVRKKRIVAMIDSDDE